MKTDTDKQTQETKTDRSCSRKKQPANSNREMDREREGYSRIRYGTKTSRRSDTAAELVLYSDISCSGDRGILCGSVYCYHKRMLLLLLLLNPLPVLLSLLLRVLLLLLQQQQQHLRGSSRTHPLTHLLTKERNCGLCSLPRRAHISAVSLNGALSKAMSPPGDNANINPKSMCSRRPD